MGKTTRRPKRRETKEKSTITFYHFTRPKYLWLICQNGVRKGDIVISASTGFNAVWLTTDPDPMNFNVGGHPSTLEKRLGRIQLEVPKNDPRLKKWSNVAAIYKVDPAIYQSLNLTGGNSAHSWWVYRGKLTHEDFITSYSLWNNRTKQYDQFTTPGDLYQSLTKKGGPVSAVDLLFTQTYPEPETSWPRLRDISGTCSNPACQAPDPGNPNMYECSKCQKIQYCSSHCQKQHWKEHKKLCFDMTNPEDLTKFLDTGTAPFFYEEKEGVNAPNHYVFHK